MKKGILYTVVVHFLAGLVYLSFLGTALAQQQPAGVVTGVQGQAELTRPTVAKPAPLRFREGVILQDVVDTREKSLARILFGGRSTVTVRELSRLEVREELLPGGARRDSYDLNSGAILVNVARQLMKPGDEVQIRTPNAVAAVRGSTIFAAFNVLLNQSFFAQLSGTGIINIQGQPPITLTPNTGLTATGSGPAAQVNQVTITAAQAKQIVSESQVGKTVKEEANKGGVVGAAVKEAAALAQAIVDTATKTGDTSGGQKTADTGTTTTTTTSTTTTAPIVPAEALNPTSTVGSPGCGSSANIVKNCGFETTGSIPNWDSSGSASIISSMKDSSGNVVFGAPEGSHMAIIQTTTSAGALSVSGCTTNAACDRSILSQTNSTDIKANKTYLVKFDYMFMSNEYPNQSSTFNDTFTVTAKGIGSGGGDVVLLTESRNGSSFKTDKPSITSSGATVSGFTNFTLSSGNGYLDCSGSCATDDAGNTTAFKAGSTTVQSGNITSGTLEFKIEDFSDTVVTSAALIDKIVVQEDPPLYEVFNGTNLIGPYQQPLVEFSDQSSTFDSVLVSSGSGPNGVPSVSLSGPLLKATNSNLTVPFSLLGLTDNSQLVSSSSDPLVWLNKGNYSLSTETGAAIFDFWGTQTTLDPDTGAEVGSGKTLTHAGPLLEASGGATVDTQKVLKLDTALLEASAPILNLIGTSDAQTSLTTQQSTIDLMRSRMNATGPVIALDRSFINVNNGPLINLTQGSNMKVTGDLISMLSGSKINVVNGPLISVAGAGSLLDVSGALVNFGGSGGNKIIVNNSIAPTATLSGLPVSATYGGSVSINGTAVKNPSLGSISVNGSLIAANNNGTVNIQGK